MGAGLKIRLGTIERICHKSKCRNGSAGFLKLKIEKTSYLDVVAIVVIDSGQHSGVQ